MTRKMFFGALVGIISAPFVKLEKAQAETVSIKIDVDIEALKKAIFEVQKQNEELAKRMNPVISVKDFQEWTERRMMSVSTTSV